MSDTAASPTTLVRQMSYNGGLLGAFSSDRKKLQVEINRQNDQGYRLAHVLPGKVSALSVVVQLVCLLLTLFLWSPVYGETLVFERG